ncbi:unnamed protein product [Parascedosporium putredinis]|uniref:Trafficking protein particle complex subunit 13 N-terminal domain-containing protein n=1 Tax=Parascedosporium putredinis TaxID=1442378 RepID=A0A9P1GX36_9PEZI|nr:unnamed protein product [Parascedosporium putredinis]CAI7988817.1 unnamed protein product [Parascedosporium putredinis]
MHLTSTTTTTITTTSIAIADSCQKHRFVFGFSAPSSLGKNEPPTVSLARPDKEPHSISLKVLRLSRPSLVVQYPLDLLPASPAPDNDGGRGGTAKGVDLESGETLQKIVSFDLKEEGNHVLAVTVSYYEATELSGRTRTFRKLYQFICKSSMIVRTKAGPLRRRAVDEGGGGRRWVLEAQLENCSEDVLQLENVLLDLRDELEYSDCNWGIDGTPRPILHPTEVEQICFIVKEKTGAKVSEDGEGRTAFGTLSIGWRGRWVIGGFLRRGSLGPAI